MGTSLHERVRQHCQCATAEGSMNQESPVGHLLRLSGKAKTRWLNATEVDCLLTAHSSLGLSLSSAPPNGPMGGDMFVYSREQCRHFRADGVAWQTRSNGKTLSEAHEVCKVPNSPTTVSVYYTCSQDGTLQRRIFRRQTEEENGQSVRDDLVLVHYLSREHAKESMIERTSSVRRASSSRTQRSLREPHTSSSCSDLSARPRLQSSLSIKSELEGNPCRSVQIKVEAAAAAAHTRLPHSADAVGLMALPMDRLAAGSEDGGHSLVSLYGRNMHDSPCASGDGSDAPNSPLGSRRSKRRTFGDTVACVKKRPSSLGLIPMVAPVDIPVPLEDGTQTLGVRTPPVFRASASVDKRRMLAGTRSAEPCSPQPSSTPSTLSTHHQQKSITRSISGPCAQGLKYAAAAAAPEHPSAAADAQGQHLCNPSFSQLPDPGLAAPLDMMSPAEDSSDPAAPGAMKTPGMHTTPQPWVQAGGLQHLPGSSPLAVGTPRMDVVPCWDLPLNAPSMEPSSAPNLGAPHFLHLPSAFSGPYAPHAGAFASMQAHPMQAHPMSTLMFGPNLTQGDFTFMQLAATAPAQLSASLPGSCNLRAELASARSSAAGVQQWGKADHIVASVTQAMHNARLSNTPISSEADLDSLLLHHAAAAWPGSMGSSSREASPAPVSPGQMDHLEQYLAGLLMEGDGSSGGGGSAPPTVHMLQPCDTLGHMAPPMVNLPRSSHSNLRPVAWNGTGGGAQSDMVFSAPCFTIDM